MTALRRVLSPILAVPGSLPADECGWADEVTFDGVRVLAAVEDERVRLSGRNNNDVTAADPQLPALATRAGACVRPVLDGEVAVRRVWPHRSRDDLVTEAHAPARRRL